MTGVACVKVESIRENYLLIGGGVGLGLYLTLLVINWLSGWTLPYPYSLFWLLLAALPGAAVAVLFLQAHSALEQEEKDMLEDQAS